jgi:hypothetical protein
MPVPQLTPVSTATEVVARISVPEGDGALATAVAMSPRTPVTSRPRRKLHYRASSGLRPLDMWHL